VVESLAELVPTPLYDDLLRSTPQTRHVAQLLASVLEYLAQPDKNTLSKHYSLLAEAGYLGPIPEKDRLRAQKALLNSAYPDRLLFPTTTDRWRESLSDKVQPLASDLSILERYVQLISRWLRALVLPVDQLLLTIAQDLFTDEPDLAITQALASSLRSIWQMHPEWRLGEYTAELKQVAHNMRGVAGFTFADAGYQAQAGHIAVITMHKAKGLEWDVVYLVSVDTLEFPDTCGDYFRSEPYCMPKRAPAQEAKTILERLAAGGAAPMDTPTILRETQQEVIAERLRLLYVGITRARRDLSITYSSLNGKRQVRLPLALRALQEEGSTS
jgi:DNA helicase-2/ATP-dependent DNA helicase PcrA